MSVIVALLIVASILSGEARGLGPDGMEAVACTMKVRMEMQSLPEVLTAYYGWSSPTADSVRIAHKLLAGKLSCPSRCVFALSEEDRRKLGWPPGERIVTNGQQTLHFFSEPH